MPHLMNCSHEDHAWCLSCVKEEWERREKEVDRLEKEILFLKSQCAKLAVDSGDWLDLYNRIKSHDSAS